MTVLTREDFENTGYSSLEQVLDDLPQNFSSLSTDNQYGIGRSSTISHQNPGRATAIDLRGLGPQSTLTLVNGTRRAGSVNGRVVDVSAIPLAALERVEIVTGGKSSIYGSDAVAGVVNLITRRAFDGLESQAQYSGTEHGGEHLQLSQIGGMQGDRGGVMLAYDYSKAWSLDLVDTGLVISPAPGGAIPLRRDIEPDLERHSALLSGVFRLASNTELYWDAGYSRSDTQYFYLVNRWPGATQDSFNFSDYEAESVDVLAGIKAGLGAGWSVDASAGYSAVDTREQRDFFSDLGFITIGPLVFNSENDARLSAVSAVFDGPLPSIGHVTPRMAIGAQTREDRLTAEDSLFFLPVEQDRTVNSAFAELFVPLITDGGVGARSLSFSLAARYDDYSDVGDTTNPQVGLIWSPVEGLNIRSAYSTSFRAPAFVEFGQVNVADVSFLADPALGGADAPVLTQYLARPDLKPEEAETWTVALDLSPVAAPWLQTTIAYFVIDYTDRIGVPAFGADLDLALENEDFFPGLVDRSPDAAETQAIVDNAFGGVFDSFGNFYPAGTDLLAAFPGLIVFDNRDANIATEKVRGIDFAVRTSHEVALGKLSAGLNATHTLEHSRSVTAQSPAFSLLNDVGLPVDTRLRADLGFERGPLSGFVHVNHVDGYRNSLSTTQPRMSSWTTVDLTLGYGGGSGFMNGLRVTLSADDLFDEAPPRLLGNDHGVAYDGANASALGRQLSLRVVKRWGGK
jgi:iron complex outermembrane recepter protein